MTEPTAQAAEGQPNTPAAGQAPTAQPAPARPAPAAVAEPSAPVPAPADDGDDAGDPRIARANRQAAEARIRAKEAAEKAAAAEAELTKLRQAAMTAEERQRADFETATKRVNELEGSTRDLETRSQSLAVENAVLRAVTNLRSAKEPLQFVDSDGVLALLDRSAIEFGDDGRPQADAMEKLLRDLAKRKPYLVAQPTTPGYTASTGNPARDRNGKDAPPTTMEDFRGKSVDWINQHWPAFVAAQKAAKPGG